MWARFLAPDKDMPRTCLSVDFGDGSCEDGCTSSENTILKPGRRSDIVRPILVVARVEYFDLVAWDDGEATNTTATTICYILGAAPVHTLVPIEL